MKEYTEAFKSKMVRKMLPPGAMTAKALARETGVNQTSLSRWLKEARTIGVMDKPAKKWTPSEKLRVVIEAGRLDDAALGEFLRGEGLHDAQLNEWRAAAEAGLSPPSRSPKSSDAKRVEELEREILRKDKALAEAAALLILQKKVRGLWGAGGEVTTRENDR